ncbi:MAG: amidohydrolase family protein [Woeseiaceae bacterium]|nr:amidohydrolase family protein [Woeseiaceae bacterium]
MGCRSARSVHRFAYGIRPADTSIEQLREGYELGISAGMGEIATQYMGFGPSDDEGVTVLCSRQRVRCAAHVYTSGNGAQMPTFRVSKGDPRLLEGVLVRFPNLRVFNENCGFPFADEMTAMMYQYPQLYCDISTILHLVPRNAALRHLKQLVDAGLDDRIMFGSDQMIWPEVIPIVIEALQSADFLSAEQKADIFYNNAARFLRLSDEEIAAHHSL